MNLFKLVLSATFCASMVACVGAGPEAGEMSETQQEASAPPDEAHQEHTGEAAEADTLCNCEVECWAPGYGDHWWERGLHHCGWTEANAFCGSIGWSAVGFKCY
jgi:uncharacterized protein CbrC (UPF0167 family)